MYRLALWTLNHKRLVVIGWLVVTLVGVFAAQPATDALTTSIALPGQSGYDANQAILALYGNGASEAPAVPVITLPAGMTVDKASVRDQLAMAMARVRRAVPGMRVVSYASTGSRLFVSADGRTTFGLLFLPQDKNSAGMQMQATAQEQAVQAALAPVTIAGARFHLTGTNLLQTTGAGGGMSAMAMTMIGILAALVVLALVFGSLLAVVPIAMAVLAILTTFLLVWVLTRVTDVSFIVQYIAALVGLGIAIDYSLLVVMRWREERARGLENTQAVLRAMETAGRAVAFSGTTVAIGMLALVVQPIPFLRSMGVGGLLVPSIAVLVVATLLPVVLSTIGPRLDWPRSRRAIRPSPFWGTWAGAVVRWRWPAAVTALLILALLAVPAFSITLGSPEAGALAKSGDAYAGLQALDRSGIGPGVLTPFEVLVDGSSAASAIDRLAHVADVRGAVAPAQADWHSGATSLGEVLPAADGASAQGRDSLANVRRLAGAMGGSARVGGVTALNADFVSAAYGRFPVIAGLLAAITLVLLSRAFRSLVLAVKAMALAAVSVAAAWGMMTFVWQDGNGSRQLWGFPASGALDAFIPLLVFAFLFGISMDYEVFLISRIREEYETSGSTTDAVVRGMAGTGRLVTSAALILFIAFASLSTAPIVMVKTFATGLAAGIFVDATVIRMLLVPALVALFGSWNWWLPRRLGWLLRPRPDEPFTEAVVSRQQGSPRAR